MYTFGWALCTVPHHSMAGLRDMVNSLAPSNELDSSLCLQCKCARRVSQGSHLNVDQSDLTAQILGAIFE